MAPGDGKPPLPPGWVCKVSWKMRPNFTYYFNVKTGASTWDLGQVLAGQADGEYVEEEEKPEIVLKIEEKEVFAMKKKENEDGEYTFAKMMLKLLNQDDE